MKPTIGRIVHYTDYGMVPRAAIIIQVHGAESGFVRLRILMPDWGEGFGEDTEKDTCYSETPLEGYWSWPPREP